MDICINMTVKLWSVCPHNRYLWSTSCWKNGTNKI